MEMPMKLRFGVGIAASFFFVLGIVVGTAYELLGDSQQYEQLRVKHNNLVGEHSNLNNEYDTLEDQIADYEKRILRDSQQHEQFRVKHNNLVGEHSNLNNEYDTLEDQIADYEKRILRDSQQHEQFRVKHNNLVGEHSNLNNEYDTLEDQIADYEKRILRDSQQHEQLRVKYNNLVGEHSDLSYEYELNYNYVKDLEKKSKITIYDQKIHWNVKDGSGNQYSWEIPIQTFEHKIKYNTGYDVRGLTNTDANEYYVVARLEPFVQKIFGNVISDVWDNSNSNDNFVYNIWSIVNNLTVYSEDIGEYPRYAEETLGRGGGDCEDLAILIADLILSSPHTKNWDVEMWYIDSDNPRSPETVNHVIIWIDDGNYRYFLEPTAKTWDSALVWNSYEVTGWIEQI